MTTIATLVQRLVDGGIDPSEAMEIITLAAIMGSKTASSAPVETPEERRKRLSREASARHRASRNVTNASPSVTSPNVTKRHETSPQRHQTSLFACVEDNNLPTEISGSETKTEKRSLRDPKREVPDVTPRRGCRLSPDWRPSEFDLAYAAKLGFSPTATDRIAEKFRNYWLAKTGAQATKLDWPATWRNWLLAEAERNPPGDVSMSMKIARNNIQ